MSQNYWHPLKFKHMLCRQEKHTNRAIKNSAAVARNWTHEHTDFPHSDEMLREAKKNPKMTVSESHNFIGRLELQFLDVSIITSCSHTFPVRYLSTNSSVCFGLIRILFLAKNAIKNLATNFRGYRENPLVPNVKYRAGSLMVWGSF